MKHVTPVWRPISWETERVTSYLQKLYVASPSGSFLLLMYPVMWTNSVCVYLSGFTRMSAKKWQHARARHTGPKMVIQDHSRSSLLYEGQLHSDQWQPWSPSELATFRRKIKAENCHFPDPILGNRPTPIATVNHDMSGESNLILFSRLSHSLMMDASHFAINLIWQESRGNKWVK